MADWLEKLQLGVRKAHEAVKTTLEREQAAFVIGKVAGKAVRDAAGRTIVEAGDTIDAAVIEDATRSGRLPMLVAAVAAANVQDVQERFAQARDATDEGAEQSALETVEDYARARQCVGKVTGLDVTDIRGTVVVSAGTRITEDHVRTARAARLLNALMHSVSIPHGPPNTVGADSNAETVHPNHTDEPPVPERRRTLPLVLPDDASRE